MGHGSFTKGTFFPTFLSQSGTRFRHFAILRLPCPCAPAFNLKEPAGVTMLFGHRTLGSAPPMLFLHGFLSSLPNIAVKARAPSFQINLKKTQKTFAGEILDNSHLSDKHRC